MTKVKRGVSRICRIIRLLIATAFVIAAICSFALNVVAYEQGQLGFLNVLEDVRIIRIHQCRHLEDHGYEDLNCDLDAHEDDHAHDEEHSHD